MIQRTGGQSIRFGQASLLGMLTKLTNIDDDEGEVKWCPGGGGGQVGNWHGTQLICGPFQFQVASSILYQALTTDGS